MKLMLCNDLFFALSEKEITYCHWKSNEHLERGLSGDTDLDILVESKDKSKFTKILDELSFRKIFSSQNKSYPGIEDYLGFDHKDGKLCHLHVYYKLIVGQKYLKNHHLPIECMVLDDLRVLNDIYVPIPEVELLLLIIRSVMKFGARSILRYILARKRNVFSQYVLNEFYFLLNEFDASRFKIVTRRLNLGLSEDRLLKFIYEIRCGKISLYSILAMRRYVFKTLKPFRLLNHFMYYRKAFPFHLRDLPVIRHIWPIPKKTIGKEGKSFALVGADGSGKSTLINDLTDWLSWKLQVEKYYFGIPKSKWIRTVQVFISLFNRIFASKSGGPGALVLVSMSQELANGFWLLIARIRLGIYKKFENYSRSGGISLADRYPIYELWAMPAPMDGPRIRKEGGNKYMKWANLEEKIYYQIAYPTKIFLLKTDLEVLRKRKNDTFRNTHNMKASAINSLDETDKICVIDANRPYSDVLKDIKRNLWKML